MAQDYVFPADEYLLLGKVTKAHGMRGEVKIFHFSGQPESIKAYKELILVDTGGGLSPPLSVLKCRVQGKVAITQLESIADRDKAEHAEGKGVLVAKKQLPQLAENEFYWHQYIDKTVRDLDGKSIGRVENIFSVAASDIMVVKSAIEEILIPISKNIVVKVTNDDIIIDPPPGLLELNSNNSP